MPKRQIYFEKDYAVIPLTKGRVALIDAGSIPALVSQCPWQLFESKGKEYAQTVVKVNGRNKKFFLHRVIAEATHRSVVVDHRNGNGLDNRRENLRKCSQSKNLYNRGPIRGRDLKGVYLRPSGRFAAIIKADKKKFSLGKFDTKEQAAFAYDAAALKYHKQFAVLNFPKELAQ